MEAPELRVTRLSDASVSVRGGKVYLAVKRAFDLVASVVALIIGAPLMLIVSALIKIESPGPAIFKQERLGKDGMAFTIKSSVDEGMVHGVHKVGCFGGYICAV